MPMTPRRKAVEDDGSASRRKSWSARFSAEALAIVESGCAITHCGVASRFVERAFLDYAAEQGALGIASVAPLVVAASKKQTLANVIAVQDALRFRLMHSARRVPSTFVARQGTLVWLSQYLVTGTARPEKLPPTPPGALPVPLNLRLLPQHLDVLASMAGDDLAKIDVLSAALRRQAENIGLDTGVDEFGIPRKWTRYPNPDAHILAATNTVEDTMLALIIAYRSLDPFKQTLAWAHSATALMSEIPRVKLSRLLDE